MPTPTTSRFRLPTSVTPTSSFSGISSKANNRMESTSAIGEVDGQEWTVIENVQRQPWAGGYYSHRITGLIPETTYQVAIRGWRNGQRVEGPWTAYTETPTTLERRTPVTISFSARSYTGTHGSDKLPVTFFLDQPASHDFTFSIRTSPDHLGFQIEDPSTPMLDCDSSGYCDITFKAGDQRTTILTQHEDAGSSHYGTFTIHEPSLPSFVTIEGIGQVDVAYLIQPEDDTERPSDVPKYRADYTAPVYSLDEGEEVIVGVSLGTGHQERFWLGPCTQRGP